MEERLELEQPPAKKLRTDNCQEQPENGQRTDANLANSPEEMDKVFGTSITIVDLHSSRLPLPLELNCEIFKCLKLPIQRKFIWGLGRDIYGMFGQKLLKKTKRVRHPPGNRWNRTNTRATVAADGLNVRNRVKLASANVFAEQPFPISGPQYRVDEFPGTICYYYEVKGDPWGYIGLSDGAVPDPVHLWIGHYPNSYAVASGFHYYELGCFVAGEPRYFELPEGAIRPSWVQDINVYGCGLVLDPADKVWIFFTLNGKLFGQKIQINPTVDRLFPSVTILETVSSFEANFGDDPAKPFKYDIHNCPGLGLACI